MAPRHPKTPPRPLAPGDVVVTFHDGLGEWTAAQVTRLDPDEELADVLDLDWSSPTRPDSLADLGVLRPLRRHRGNWNGQHSHSHAPWVLPRSCTVIGGADPLIRRSSDTFGLRWGIGDALSWERLDASGRADEDDEPGKASIKGPGFQVPEEVDPTTRQLYVSDVEHLDAAILVAAFPNLADLFIYGDLGTMSNAGALNRLTRLRELTITGYFGMAAADCLTVEGTPELEYVDLHNIPHEYATAMRRVWRPEAANGTHLSVTGARKPDWVTENKDNPLRDWDDREGISKTAYKKSLAQFTRTRRQIIEALDDPTSRRAASLTTIGSEYGEAFNAIDLATRDHFIMTEEREELYQAVIGVLEAAAGERGLDLTSEKDALLDGLDATRDW
ncbi:hypothetical protein AB1046_07985 [Promicromonospora sp. Populi]|uniref:hypothetical protein n=1 Tax=Promicromonospora sp. Populi TaxID=3239420 RepID=UPI0034E2195F